jgi:hypothetical protein
LGDGVPGHRVGRVFGTHKSRRSLRRPVRQSGMEAQQPHLVLAEFWGCPGNQGVEFGSLGRARAAVGGGGLPVEPGDDVGARVCAQPWVGIIDEPVGAENTVRAGQAACRYSWRMPPSRSRRRMSMRRRARMPRQDQVRRASPTRSAGRRPPTTEYRRRTADERHSTGHVPDLRAVVQAAQSSRHGTGSAAAARACARSATAARTAATNHSPQAMSIRR